MNVNIGLKSGNSATKRWVTLDELDDDATTYTSTTQRVQEHLPLGNGKYLIWAVLPVLVLGLAVLLGFFNEADKVDASRQEVEQTLPKTASNVRPDEAVQSLTSEVALVNSEAVNQAKNNKMVEMPAEKTKRDIMVARNKEQDVATNEPVAQPPAAEARIPGRNCSQTDILFNQCAKN